MFPAHPAYMDYRPCWDLEVFMAKARSAKPKKPAKPSKAKRGGFRK